jgi:hypothetical protein
MRRFFKIGPYEPKFGRKNLWKALISSWSVNIHGRHRRLVSDWLILKILLFCNRLAKCWPSDFRWEDF